MQEGTPAASDRAVLMTERLLFDMMIFCRIGPITGMCSLT